MAEEPKDEDASATLPMRPLWVTPELVELKIWSDTLGTNAGEPGDQPTTFNFLS
jgi:hypothetical protein